MAARKRYVAGKNIKINDIALEGQRFILLGDCDQQGRTKNGSKALTKKQKTHVKLRIEDKQWMRENKLKIFYEHTITKPTFEKFFTLAE